MKYSDAYSAIFSLFASTEWTNEAIKTFPDNFTVTSDISEFIRVSVVFGKPGTESFGTNSQNSNISGLLYADLFTPTGYGQLRSMFLSDKLDSYLVNRTRSVLAGNVQFMQSNLSKIGTDSANKMLYHSLYQIPFSYFSI